MDAYYEVLKDKLNYGKAQDIPFDKNTGIRKGNIPAGNIIFINGLNHVVIYKGTEDGNGRHQVLSLWVIPDKSGVMQDTILEDVSKPIKPVKFAPAPW
ncbi:hypothetical protein Cylst_3400 [Cylindrospermum stagnale PCC 7417]|uniref:Uncharacterized protein n=1 Tax=Cylindrospermum stagnale PCC 7417 TaxID=56107 RepID=K9WYV5_9NOST|nr:hypothetical protein [Cylindrospermum stagnale]AFZ25550.1 hypothetical protein Cylst_3400 [Cylindrospermum stagnale PCC 7417]